MNFIDFTLNSLTTNGKGIYGISASAVDYSSSLPTYLRITDINDDGTINKSGLKSVADENSFKYELEENDIVFARTGGSTGRNYFYDKRDGDFVFAGFLIKFSIDPSKVNPKYIKYYCQSQKYWDWVHSYNTGSTRGNINAQTYGKMIISVPSRAQQDGIVNILSFIDEKISYNNKINDNLEYQLIAFYNELFVNNFDKNWNNGTICDVGSVVGGGTPSTANEDYYTTTGIAWITPKDLSNNHNKFIKKGRIDITNLGYKNSSTIIMPKGTILFSSRAPIGYIAISDGEITTNQGFKSIIPSSNLFLEYIYCFLKQNILKIENMASGTTFKEISGAVMKKVPIVIPDNRTIDRFHRFASGIFSKQKAIQYETNVLIEMRDTLLPKLMSGEIDVSNIKLDL